MARLNLDNDQEEKKIKKEVSRKKSCGFFKKEEWWEKEWQGMPEYNQDNELAFKVIYVHFVNKEDMEKFAKLIGQTITMNTKFIWYPKAKIKSVSNKRYIDES